MSTQTQHVLFRYLFGHTDTQLEKNRSQIWEGEGYV